MIDLIACAKANRAIMQRNVAVSAAAIFFVAVIGFILNNENEKRKKNGLTPFF